MSDDHIIEIELGEEPTEQIPEPEPPKRRGRKAKAKAPATPKFELPTFDDKEISKYMLEDEPKPYKEKRKGKEPKMEELDEKDIKLRVTLLHQINEYHACFKDRLKESGYKPHTNLESKKLEQLKSIKTEIHSYLGLKNDAVVKPLFLLSCNGLENLLPELGIDCNGLTNSLNNNIKVDECLKEMCIEMNMSSYIPPHYRLGIIMITTIYALNNINGQKKKHEQQINITTEQKINPLDREIKNLDTKDL